MTVTEARATFSELLERSRLEAVILARQGRPEAVVICPEQYEPIMVALEDAEDVRAFDDAVAEEGENSPWAQAGDHRILSTVDDGVLLVVVVTRGHRRDVDDR